MTVLITHVVKEDRVWMVSTVTRVTAWQDTLEYIVRLLSRIKYRVLVPFDLYMLSCRKQLSLKKTTTKIKHSILVNHL